MLGKFATPNMKKQPHFTILLAAIILALGYQTTSLAKVLSVDEYMVLVQQESGNPQAAVNQLVAQADQNDAAAQFNLGTALMMLKAHLSAVKVLTRAIELAPRNASAHANLATSAFYLEKCDVTITSIEKALALGPTSNDDPWHWNGLLGHCYLRTEQYSKALAPCERMRALLPQDPRGELCVAKANLGKKNYEAATSGFLRVYNMTRANPYHMTAYIGAFAGLAKQQKLGQAVELLRLNPAEYSTTQELERTARWAEQSATPSNREWWQF
jgi:tetratricopeptide (TPR) repeat protein